MMKILLFFALASVIANSIPSNDGVCNCEDDQECVCSNSVLYKDNCECVPKYVSVYDRYKGCEGGLRLANGDVVTAKERFNVLKRSYRKVDNPELAEAVKPLLKSFAKIPQFAHEFARDYFATHKYDNDASAKNFLCTCLYV